MDCTTFQALLSLSLFNDVSAYARNETAIIIISQADTLP